MSPLTPIYVYSDPNGTIVDKDCEEQITSRIQERTDRSRIIKIPDTSYLQREISKKEGILVIPGGNTFALSEQLTNAELIPKIRSAVSNGWNYLGFCSGGSLAGRELIYNTEGLRYLEFVKSCDLSYEFLNLLPFESDITVYPITKKNIAKKHTNDGDNGRIVRVLADPIGEFNCYWNEGSKFSILDRNAGIKTEAVYAEFADKPAAIVSGRFGLGNVVATGIHPEMEPDPSSIKQESFESAQRRSDFLDGIFELVGIKEIPVCY